MPRRLQLRMLTTITVVIVIITVINTTNDTNDKVEVVVIVVTTVTVRWLEYILGLFLIWINTADASKSRAEAQSLRLPSGCSGFTVNEGRWLRIGRFPKQRDRPNMKVRIIGTPKTVDLLLGNLQYGLLGSRFMVPALGLPAMGFSGYA